MQGQLLWWQQGERLACLLEEALASTAALRFVSAGDEVASALLPDGHSPRSDNGTSLLVTPGLTAHQDAKERATRGAHKDAAIYAGPTGNLAQRDDPTVRFLQRAGGRRTLLRFLSPSVYRHVGPGDICRSRIPAGQPGNFCADMVLEPNSAYLQNNELAFLPLHQVMNNGYPVINALHSRRLPRGQGWHAGDKLARYMLHELGL